MRQLSVLARLLAACVLLQLLAVGAARSPAAAAEVRVRFVPSGEAGLDLARLTFQDLKAMVLAVEEGGELVLPLPGAGSAVDVPRCELVVDDARRTLVAAGRADVRGRAARVFLSATFPPGNPGGRGLYAFGVRPDALELGAWFPSLASTPLAAVALEDAVLIASSAPHELPSTKLVAEILGARSGDADSFSVPAGVGLRATLAADGVPAVGRLLSRLGIAESQLALSGTLSTDADLLLAERTAPLDVDLAARLDANALNGWKGLPTWLRPAKAAPSLTLTRARSGPLVATLALDVTVEAGDAPRPFRIACRLDPGENDAALTLRGGTTGAWERPFGIEWLSLAEAELVVRISSSGTETELSSTVRIGSRDARLNAAIDGPQSARFDVRLDALSVAELAEFVAARTGSTFVDDLALGDAVELADVLLSIGRGPEGTSLEATGTVGIGGAKVDLLLGLARRGKEKIAPIFAIRRPAGSLGDLIPALKNKVGDLSLPQAVWTLTPPKGGGSGGSSSESSRVSSAELGTAARAFFAEVYGTGNFVVELQPGITLGARLPVGKLPPALLTALGIEDKSAVLFLKGSIATTLDLAKGGPSATVQFLEFTAELPRVAAATARLPEGLPSWMRVDASAQKSIVVRYTAPDTLEFLKVNDVLADLDGATRHFRVLTSVSADADEGRVSLTGSLVGDWKKPFGLKALTLRDVTIGAGGGAAGANGTSGSLHLEGGFDLGPKTGRVHLELGTGARGGVAGVFVGSFDDLALTDLPKLGVFPKPPTEALKALNGVLGKLPALEEPTLRIELGGGTPSATLSSQIKVNGAGADLLAFVGRGRGGPEAVLAIRPQKGFTLAKLLPKLGQNPLVAPLANQPIDRFGLLLVLGDQVLKAGEVAPEVRDYFVKLTGEQDFELDLNPGLNVEARLTADSLPQDIKLALERLNETMGFDQPSSLRLRGALGLKLQDMRLAAALPPLRPRNAPKWIKQGELEIVITGLPSLMLAGTLTLDCDGDLLDLIVEGGVERQGANVAIALKGALQAQQAWTSPFGMEWLEIRRFSGQVSIDALANIGFGGGGDVTIGSKDIKVFAWTKINSASGVPMGLVVNGESEVGVGLSDLTALFAKMSGSRANSLSPAALPDISLRSCKFLIASRAVPEEGIDSAGFRIKGDLFAALDPHKKASKMLAVDCGVSSDGIVAKGYIGALDVGPLTWDDSYFDLELSPREQHMLVHGKVTFLGSSSLTDLQFTRESLSFNSERTIKGLGTTSLLVKSSLDLKRPSFHARGELDNEFSRKFSESALAELTDVVGKAAVMGTMALDAVEDARLIMNKRRAEFGLMSTPADTIDAVALKRLKDAKADAEDQKLVVARKWKEWQDTPASKPALSKARELAWGQAKIAYDQGPLSKVAVVERRQEQYDSIHAVVAALADAKAESLRVQKTLGTTLGEIAKHDGPTLVIKSAAIEAKLDALMVLKDGMTVAMSLDVLFCGQPKAVRIDWTLGDMADNAKQVVEAVMPAVSKLVNG